MDTRERLLALRRRAQDNAQHCIFPFWASEYLLDKEHGGFYGRVTLEMERDNTAPRSLVVTGRMVYAFSHAYLEFGDALYLERARDAFTYLMDHFYDREFGGAFSAVDQYGQCVDDAKPLYAEAFFVMACAAYFLAARDPEARRAGLDMFSLIETKTKRGPGDYPNNWARDWSPAAAGTGMAFPAGAVVFPHHLCQAYEQLYRATGDVRIKPVLAEMAGQLTSRFYDAEHHCFCTLLDAGGARLGTRQSYGHDCELSYLAMDVAELCGSPALTARVKTVCEDVLRQVLAVGFDDWHSLYNGIDLATGEREQSHVWWAQAEAVTAMLFGYQLTGDEAFLLACEAQLDYIERYFVNEKDGDWYNNVVVDETGRHIVDGMHGFDKLNGGKCPFHNSHMCFEVIRRTGELLAQ